MIKLRYKGPHGSRAQVLLRYGRHTRLFVLPLDTEAHAVALAMVAADTLDSWRIPPKAYGGEAVLRPLAKATRHDHRVAQQLAANEPAPVHITNSGLFQDKSSDEFRRLVAEVVAEAAEEFKRSGRRLGRHYGAPREEDVSMEDAALEVDPELLF